MKHRYIFLSSRLRSTDPLQRDCYVPAPLEQDAGSVFKQENGGQYLSFTFFPCTQGLQKTSAQKSKGRKETKKGQKARITQSWMAGEPAHQWP